MKFEPCKVLPFLFLLILCFTSTLMGQGNNTVNLNNNSSNQNRNNQVLNNFQTGSVNAPTNQLPPGDLNVAIVYLKNGENIHGYLTEVTGNTVILESSKGYGVLTIPKTDILLISFPESQINVSRRYGLGYVSKNTTIDSVSETVDYNVNQISLRTYVTGDFALQWLAGFGNLAVKSQNTETVALNDFTINSYQVILAGVRGISVFSRGQNNLTYWGLGAGFVQLTNDELGLDEAGLSATLFLGAELFIESIPNFGFSGEISLDYLNTETLSRTEINVSPIPSFSIHYYF